MRKKFIANWELEAEEIRKMGISQGLTKY